MAKPAYVWDGSAWITIAPAVVNPYPSQTGNDGKYLKTDGTQVSWASVDAFPSQTGNSGKYLTTDGTEVSWSTVEALPTQTGNSGKFLTTDGTIATWETIDAFPSQTGNSGKFLTTDGTETSWSTIDFSTLVSKSGGDTITASTSSTIPLTIKGASSQSAFLQVWENSSGNDLVTISSSGELSSQTISTTGNVSIGGTITSGIWEGSTISSLYLDPDLARLASPAFTGVPTAPTPTVGTNTTQIATTEFVQKTLEITQLDTFTFDGRTSRFIPTYLGDPVEIDHPLRLLLNINGIIQIVAEKPSVVWLSGIASYGYYIDDGYIVLPEPPEAGSYFEARLFPGVDLQKRPDTYPFRAIDIYLGD